MLSQVNIRAKSFYVFNASVEVWTGFSTLKKNKTSVSFGGCEDLKDMSTMVLRTRGPAKLPDGYKLAMHISQGDAESIRVFRQKSSEGKYSTFGECSFP